MIENMKGITDIRLAYMANCVILTSLLLFSSCAERETDAGQKEECDDVLTTVLVKTNEGESSVELGEGSTISFTDKYMVIKTSGKETMLPLNKLTQLSYK